MADQPTPAQLRAAAELLGKATVRRMPADERAAHLLLAAETLGFEDTAGQACSHLARECTQHWWTSDLHYLAQSARLRLLVDAEYEENADMNGIATAVAMWWKETQRHD